MLGGGQEAMEVTTTTTKADNLVFEEEIGRSKDTLVPSIAWPFILTKRGTYLHICHSLACVNDDPLPYSYSRGGEDGDVRVHTFDPFEFET